MTNRKLTATSRLKQDYMRLKRDPVPYITAEPLPSNILEWHYVVKGPEDSPYYGGYYYGTLLFAKEFPFKPPSIFMTTPNGRFKTNTRLCLSISDFHPDTWNPTWSVSSILTGLLSFMLENTPTMGSTESTIYEKRQYAQKSLEYNLKNVTFRELFPEICDEIQARLNKEKQQIIQLHLKQLKQQLEKEKGSEKDGASAEGDDTRADGERMIGADSVKHLNANNNVSGDNKLRTKESAYNWNSICSNLIVLISFALFALIVNYVIKSLNQE